jgi:hypothetical protein
MGTFIFPDPSYGYQKGNTDSRPTSPTLGDLYSNTETGYIEVYIAGGWSQLGVIPKTPSTPVASNLANTVFGAARASIAFTPDNTGGLASTYTAISTPGSITGSSSSSPITVSGLNQGTSYTFTVTATNGYGNSLATSASNSVSLTSVPQAPTIGSALATGISGTAAVAFTAGATGGSAITTYTATSSPGGLTGSSATSPITVAGLTNGTGYTFTVTATNANGVSSASSASNSITPYVAVAPSTVEYLVVGGGGSGGPANGGSNGGGGGGGGGYRTSNSFSVASGTPLTVTVGAASAPYGQGNDSVFSTITSTGGGRGGGGAGGSTGTAGFTGGSGGGGGNGTSTGGAGGAGNTPSTSPSQGNNGGAGTNNNAGGGGGGAGGAGSAGSSNNGGNGGAGASSSITGTSTLYAYGGGGFGWTGSNGVNGNGSSSGTAPTANTGSAYAAAQSGVSYNLGASGVVVIAYPDTNSPLASIGAGLTYDQPSRSGYRVYRFTGGTGSITF